MPEQIDNSPKSPDSTHNTLVGITWEASLATIYIILTGGAFLTGFGLYLGANDFEIGLLVAIPFLTQVAQLVSAYFIDLSGKRRLITIWSLAISRHLWWLVIPLPFLHGNWRLIVLLLVVAFSSISTMIGTAGWFPWLADLVPEKIRGRYFGVRSRAVSIVTVSVVMIGGGLIDYFKGINLEGTGFAILFGVACIFAFSALEVMKRLPDNFVKPEGHKLTWDYVLEPIRDAKFKRLLWIFVAWFFSIGISAPFFTPHMLTNLKMSFTQVSLYSSGGALMAILLNKAWGVLVDRFGCKPVLSFTAFGISIIPLIWFIPRAGHNWILAFEALYSGALWTGFNLGAFNIPIANSPKEKRTIYLAMFSVFTGLAFFIGSILAGSLAETWSNIHWPWGSQTIVNYHLLFALSAILRLLSSFLMLTFHEPQDRELPDMIQFMGFGALKWFSSGRQTLDWFYKTADGIAHFNLGGNEKKDKDN